MQVCLQISYKKSRFPSCVFLKVMSSSDIFKKGRLIAAN